MLPYLDTRVTKPHGVRVPQVRVVKGVPMLCRRRPAVYPVRGSLPPLSMGRSWVRPILGAKTMHVLYMYGTRLSLDVCLMRSDHIIFLNRVSVAALSACQGRMRLC